MKKISLFHADLTSVEKKRIRREVLTIALPAMGENALQMVLGLVDTAFLGYLSWQAMAAAGLANQVFFIFQAFLVAIATGSSVLIANAVGAKNKNAVRSTSWNGIYLALLIGVTITVLSSLSAIFVNAGAGASEEVKNMAASYLRINLLGGCVLSMMFVLSAQLRGAGDTKSPLLASLIANSLNAFLDYLLIFGKFGFPAMGVEGAALATVLSRLVGTVILGLIIFRSPRFGLLEKGSKGFSLKKIKEILRVGLPTSMENLLFSIGMLVFANILLMAGDQAYAAHRVGINIESISFMPGFGVSVALTALVGQYNGRNDLRMVRGIVKEGWMIACGFMVCAGLFISLFPEFLIRIFTDDATIIAMAAVPVRIIGIVQFFLATDSSITGSLRGVGETKIPFYISVLSVWGMRLPIGFIMVKFFNLGLLGAWIGMMTDFIARSIIKLVIYSRGKWVKTAEKTRKAVDTKDENTLSSVKTQPV
jgi:MATE family multidrug resistance protein